MQQSVREGMGRYGLGWAGLGWAGPDRAWLNGLGWIELGLNGMECSQATYSVAFPQLDHFRDTTIHWSGVLDDHRILLRRAIIYRTYGITKD